MTTAPLTGQSPLVASTTPSLDRPWRPPRAPVLVSQGLPNTFSTEQLWEGGGEGKGTDSGDPLGGSTSNIRILQRKEQQQDQDFSSISGNFVVSLGSATIPGATTTT